MADDCEVQTSYDDKSVVILKELTIDGRTHQADTNGVVSLDLSGPMIMQGSLTR